MFEEEDDDRKEYQKQLGLVGLQLIALSESLEGYDNSGDYSRGSYSRRMDDMYDPPANSDDGGDYYPRRSIVMDNYEDASYSDVPGDDPREAAQSFVEQLKSTTIKVRLTNVMADLIDPMYGFMRKLFNDMEEKAKHRQNENGMYLSKILRALDHMNKAQSADRGYYLAAMEFFRNPLLRIGRGLADIISGAFSFGFGALFGRDTKKSDSERIVDAINRQTEWHMNNAIDQKKGFFDRLKSQGILGMAVRGVANKALGAMGVKKDRAQEIEDNAANGVVEAEDANASFISRMRKKMQDSMSSRIYGDEITLRGRKQKPEPMKIVIDQVVKTSDIALFNLVSSIFGGNSDNTQEKDITDRVVIIDKTTNGRDECVCQGMIAESIGRFIQKLEDVFRVGNEKTSEMLSDLNKSVLDGSKELVNVPNVIVESDVSMYEASRIIGEKRDEADYQFRKKAVEREIEVSELLAEQRDGVFEVVKHTKLTAKEARLSRIQAMWQGLLSFGSKILSSIATVAAGIATGVASIVGAIWASSKLRGGTNLPSLPDGVGGPENGRDGARKGVGKAGLIAGALAGGAAMFGSSEEVQKAIEDSPTLTKTLDVVDKTGTGSLIGGLLGALVGGVGGALGGGVAGLGVGAIPGAIAGASSGYLLGSKVGAVGGFGYGVVSNATEDTPVEHQNMVQATKEGVQEPQQDVQQPSANPEQRPQSIVERSSEKLKEMYKSADENYISPSLEYVKDKTGVDVEKTASSLVEQTSKQLNGMVESANSEIIRPAVEVVKSEVASVRDEYGTAIANFGKDVVESTRTLVSSYKTEMKVLQSELSIRLDSMREVFDSMRASSKETITELIEGNRYSKEMVDVLRKIANNTGTKSEQGDTAVFSDTTDAGIMRSIFGR